MKYLTRAGVKLINEIGDTPEGRARIRAIAAKAAKQTRGATNVVHNLGVSHPNVADLAAATHIRNAQIKRVRAGLRGRELAGRQGQSIARSGESIRQETGDSESAQVLRLKRQIDNERYERTKNLPKKKGEKSNRSAGGLFKQAYQRVKDLVVGKQKPFDPEMN